MQQTDKYKLNKPGVDDPITPLPLNENMDKIEAALETKADAALEQRVITLEARHIYVGSYTGTSVAFSVIDQTIHLGFTPIAVLVQFHEKQNGAEVSRMHLLTAENPPLGGTSGDKPIMRIVDGGFVASTYTSKEWNDGGKPYHFIAFA